MLVEKRRFDLRYWLGGIFGILFGLSLGGFVFGRLVHEILGHALICYLFDLPYIMSINEILYGMAQVSYIESPNALINLLVRLSGGISQALFSLLFFGLVKIVQSDETVRKRLVFNKVFQHSGSPVQSVFFGVDLALLIIAFHGAVTAVIEGFFYEDYIGIAGNLMLWFFILLLCGIASLLILSEQTRSLTINKVRKTLGFNTR